MQPSSDWLLWQLADSAFPTGGFAHSAGLEAAFQHGAVPDGAALSSYLQASLRQIGQAALPFVMTVYAEPARLPELDRLCDAFTSNHVANRASRLQGRAFFSAVERIYRSQEDGPGREGQRVERPSFGHFAPVFGALTRSLGLGAGVAARLFLFNQLRGMVAAAVRLNIVGPMEGQSIQHRLSPRLEEILARGATLTLDDLAQTAPLLDLWQGSHDRLYSRLFQS